MTPADIRSLRRVADVDHRAARIAFHEMRVATLKHGTESSEALASYRAWRRALEAADGSRARLINAEYAHPAAAHLSLADGEELARLPNEPSSTYNARRKNAARLATLATLREMPCAADPESNPAAAAELERLDRRALREAQREARERGARLAAESTRRRLPTP